MEDAFKDLLCQWRAPALRVVLGLMTYHSMAWPAWAVRLVTNPFPIAGHGDMPWIEALDYTVQRTASIEPEVFPSPIDTNPDEVLLRAMALACLLFSTPAREVLCSDSRLVYTLFQTKPPTRAEVQRMLPLLNRHVMAWAHRDYADPLAFVKAVRHDWMYGVTMESIERRAREEQQYMRTPLRMMDAYE